MTMTSGWLLLLLFLLVVSSPSLDSQPTIDDDDHCDDDDDDDGTCGEGAGLLSQTHRDVEQILDNQRQLFQQQQNITSRLGDRDRAMERLLDNQQQLFQRLGEKNLSCLCLM